MQKWLEEASKMQRKSELTLILEVYLAKLQRTLTYALFMAVIQCPFPQFADGLGNSVQAWSLLQVRRNLVDLSLLVVQILLKNLNYKRNQMRDILLSRLRTW